MATWSSHVHVKDPETFFSGRSKPTGWRAERRRHSGTQKTGGDISRQKMTSERKRLGFKVDFLQHLWGGKKSVSQLFYKGETDVKKKKRSLLASQLSLWHHGVLWNRLKRLVGISGTALDQFSSNFAERVQHFMSDSYVLWCSTRFCAGS